MINSSGIFAIANFLGDLLLFGKIKVKKNILEWQKTEKKNKNNGYLILIFYSFFI